MTAVVEGRPFPRQLLVKESSPKPSDAVVFVGISLALGIASRHLLRGTKVPYTVALLIIGTVLGSLAYGTNHRLGKVGDGINRWANINPDLLLAVFLPPLLFESSFSMEVHQIKRCMVQMVLLAGPGVLISTFCLGSAVKLTFPYNWSWKISLLLGGLLSTTDPVAVVALLKELGASKKLSTITEGETAIVVYQLFYQMVLGQISNVGDIIKSLTQVILGAVGIGLAFGIASVLWLRYIFNDKVIEIALTLPVSYIAYFTAQEGAAVSGVLTVMTFGMFYSAVARTAFKGEGRQSLHHFWEMVAYIANTLIFILSGVIIAQGVLRGVHHFEGAGTSWGYLILLFVFVQVSRAIVVVVLYPFLWYFGNGLDWKEAIILMWSGLRGTVALALSLSFKHSSDNSPFLDQGTGFQFVFFTGGIVFLTLIVNGSTAQFILHHLGLDKLSAAKRHILDHTRNEMMSKALEAFGDLGNDEELGPADWPTVKRYIACLSDLEGGQVQPQNASESDHNLEHMNLEDIRVRLLNGVQAAYWAMLGEGRITQATANLLMRSVDEAIDLVSQEPLCDWSSLKSHVHFPNYYRFLQMSICTQNLVTYFIMERLESACCICAAFLGAHRTARRRLHEFIGENGVTSIVIKESEAEGVEAKQLLEYVRVTFPEVLRVVRTRQVTHSILQHLSDYIHNLEKVGLLEEKEMICLHDAVQTDLNKLIRNPPLVKMPKINNLSALHPFIGALPSVAREPLLGSAKDMVKLHGIVLYKEGSKTNGIWLISNGFVKSKSKILRNNHSMHPTFSHGSTLGLYEVLVGKRYICDIITDSVVHCFFIETEKILSVLRSDPAVEDFLWKESAIILAKLLHPQIFEKMSMQELRVLFAERSMINIYIREETVEVPNHSIGLLLEGLIKKQDVQELITSPAALFPSYGDQSFTNIETTGGEATGFCHQRSWYQVETRARVILFDIAAFEADSVLLKRSASLVSHAIDPQRFPSKEYGRLMNSPKNFYEPKQCLPHPDGADEKVNNLSARAIQVGVTRRQTQSFPGTSQAESSHSQSYPTVPSMGVLGHQLVSPRYEGAATVPNGFKAKGLTGPNPSTQFPSRRTKESQLVADSSDESGGDDEFIVRIDSPSRLSFH